MAIEATFVHAGDAVPVEPSGRSRWVTCGCGYMAFLVGLFLPAYWFDMGAWGNPSTVPMWGVVVASGLLYPFWGMAIGTIALLLSPLFVWRWPGGRYTRFLRALPWTMLFVWSAPAYMLAIDERHDFLWGFYFTAVAYTVVLASVVLGRPPFPRSDSGAPSGSRGFPVILAPR